MIFLFFGSKYVFFCLFVVEVITEPSFKLYSLYNSLGVMGVAYIHTISSGLILNCNAHSLISSTTNLGYQQVCRPQEAATFSI